MGLTTKMISMRHPLRVSFCDAAMILIGSALLLPVFHTPAYAQKEVTSKLYREREVSTGLPAFGRQILRTGLLAVAPTAATVRVRKYLPDAHVGLKFYYRRTCVQCHPQQARSMHEVRAKITCRQCHGKGGQTNGTDQSVIETPKLPTAAFSPTGLIPVMDQDEENFAPPTTAVFDAEPIAGIDHYYSPMNRLRRHAFVCAKCHPGASASFATYVVHAPNPAMRTTQKSFPLMFYVFWGMMALAGGTFVVFLPHTALWGMRELYLKKKAKGETEH